MKIGDYVRTKSYGIRKIEGFSSSLAEDFINCDYNEYQNVLINKKEITKSSPKIIDLIEVGDILLYNDGSACRVLEITDNYYLLKGYVDDGYERKEWLECVDSIITKEQIEKCKYKILKGEKNEL